MVAINSPPTLPPIHKVLQVALFIPEGAKLYGYYKFGNCTFLAGKTDGHIMSVTPYQNFGFENNNHTGGFGWGSIYDTRSVQVRFSQDVSKTFGYDIFSRPTRLPGR